MPKAKTQSKKKNPSNTKRAERKKNPLFEKRPKNFGIGNAVQPKRDLSRFVRWPKYILLQRQKKILLQRLKVPPAIHQFQSTLDKNQTSKLFTLLRKYSPETTTEKKSRLLKAAEQKAQDKKPDQKKVVPVLKFGLNHVTTLVENKRAKLVVIAYDVDPIELVVWLPQLCRRQEVPFCFVRNKARLGTLVHQKNAAVVAITDVRKEDTAELDNLAREFRHRYNENYELTRVVGGGKIRGSQEGIRIRRTQESRCYLILNHPYIKQKKILKHPLFLFILKYALLIVFCF
ncbi:Dedicator of cytokinesis protein 4 [Paramecium bursaria]